MTDIPQLALSDFQRLFTGNNLSFGQHAYGKFTKGKKETGGKSWTVYDEVITQDRYEKHLNGEQGLGIVPINKENKTKFMVIDVDVYNPKDTFTVITAIEKNDLPLTVFTSKSGGHHIYIFFDDFIPVVKARKILERFKELLSIDKLCKNDNKMGLEIFPKQNKLTASDKGSWINLPYYGEYKEGDKPRARMIVEGKPVSLEEALILIKSSKIISEKQALEYLDNLEYQDAPPCLQSLYYLKNVESFRNNYLFTWGVYFKKVNEDNYESEIYKINQSLVEPLGDEELEKTVLQSVRKKAYSYKCNDDPCATFCNKTECKKRTYGIGDGGYVTELDFGELSQVLTDPPYYEWEINQKGIRFKSEDDILNQNMFRKICVRKLHYAPYKLKDSEWVKIINDCLANLKIVNVDYHEDTSPGAQLRRLFAEFILDRPRAKSRDQILLGRVYENLVKGGFFFRTKDLIHFLFHVKMFRGLSQVEIHGFLKDSGCELTKERTSEGNTKVKQQSRGYFISKEFFNKLGEYENTTTAVIDFLPDEDVPDV